MSGAHCKRLHTPELGASSLISRANSRGYELATRRYAVIRGRRARPLASSKGASVEVFDSVKDALKDVSDDSGEPPSEADDEDEDVER